MSPIHVFCTLTGRSVETGIETDWATFFGLASCRLRLRCPECGEQHEVNLRDGYLARSQAASEFECEPLAPNPRLEVLSHRLRHRRAANAA